MRELKKLAAGMMVLGLACLAIAVQAQAPLFQEQKKPASVPEAVEYLYPEQISLPVGKPSAVVLHFRVAPGLHINSHHPKDEFLVPTTLSLPEGSGVRLEVASYPPGVDYTLPADQKTRLNVYSGDFTIETRLLASSGDHLVEAKLRYQACDENACMPPKTITVPIDVVGK